VLGVVLLFGGCATAPSGAYFPRVSEPATLAISHSLYRAAEAAGDDPGRYSFGMIKTEEAAAFTTDDATFFFSDGLARLPQRIVEPIVAHEVAHEVLKHWGARRNLSLSITAGFTVLGVVFPGVGLVDLLVNPLVVRAYSRDQELAADARSVQILTAMGYATPRRSLATALTAVDRANGSPTATTMLSTHPALAARLAALGSIEPPSQLAAATEGILAR